MRTRLQKAGPVASVPERDVRERDDAAGQKAGGIAPRPHDVRPAAEEPPRPQQSGHMAGGIRTVSMR